jgi:hypothetical protein
MAEIAYRRYAMLIAGALAVGLAAVVAHSASLNGKRGELERWSERTAVGDKELYPMGEQAPPLVFRGKPLTPTSGEPHEMRETRAIRVGDDDSHHFRIYIHRDNLPREGETADPTYLVKVGPNSFLKLQAAERK